MDIRVETDADRPDVEGLHEAAFADPVLPELVRGLRAGDGFVPGWSVVAVDDGRVVGHTMVTRVPLEAQDGTLRAVPCLSPLGVLPAAQGRGVGRALVEAACAAVEADGEPFVVLEGNPAMYTRFGFVAASGRGLRRPSERTPVAAFQVRGLAGDRPDDPGLRGRVLYPDVFWDLDCVGRPLGRPAFLDAFEHACRLVETACRTADGAPDPRALRRKVRACPGWTVADVVQHLGFIHRFVAAWVGGGRRPRPADRPQAPAPDDPGLLPWFAAGWRALQELLDARGFDTPTATWSPWDATAGFWFRRMAHEAVVHAQDVCDAVPDKTSGQRWLSELALDGIDEVVRLWLGTRLGEHAGGEGQLVRIETQAAVPLVPSESPSAWGEGLWTVGLHGGITETHDVPTEPDAVVAGMPETMYLWLWGRGGTVRETGDPQALAALRAALTRALQ